MKQPDKKIAFIILYNNVDHFPPTISAIHYFSRIFEQVFVFEMVRPEATIAAYPTNVRAYRIVHRSSSYWTRLQVFMLFVRKLAKCMWEIRPSLILFYDAASALALYLLLFIAPVRPMLWYHNHDIPDHSTLKKFSLNDISIRVEKRMFRHLDIFSLPAEERKKYYFLGKFKGKYFFIPNFPSIQLFPDYQTQAPKEEIHLVYQGSICALRGIKEIIEILPYQIDGKKIIFQLCGFPDKTFVREVNEIIARRKLTDVVKFHPISPYRLLPAFSAQQHIGIAIFTGTDVMNATLGTASNKVYEYTACGLPFIYYDNDHFRFHFKELKWGVSTDLTKESLVKAITTIVENYPSLSDHARENFVRERNFEHVFQPAAEYMQEKLGLKKQQEEPAGAVIPVKQS